MLTQYLSIQRNNISAGFGSYGHKRALWLAINAVNALEGVRFYVSFACSWAFAELKKMEGNAKIIKFIARDENVHLASTTTLIKLMPQDDPDFAKLKEECKDEVLAIFGEGVTHAHAGAVGVGRGGARRGGR
ncbi:MAG: ribonucleotide-diphosphate reductase subunit beta, partial [Methylophagaceae bacterium]